MSVTVMLGDGTNPASEPLVVDWSLQNVPPSYLENKFIRLINCSLLSWRFQDGATASFNNVDCVMVNPQDGGKSFGLSGPNSVSELANKVGNFLADGKNICISVLLIPGVTSPEGNCDEQCVCVQSESTNTCFRSRLLIRRCSP